MCIAHYSNLFARYFSSPSRLCAPSLHLILPKPRYRSFRRDFQGLQMDHRCLPYVPIHCLALPPSLIFANLICSIELPSGNLLSFSISSPLYPFFVTSINPPQSAHLFSSFIITPVASLSLISLFVECSFL